MKIMKPGNPRVLTGRRALMLAATISTFAAVDRAKAACDPVSPIVGTNVTVTCTGTTDNQNDPFGSTAALPIAVTPSTCCPARR
jgi:hypothetical protein